MPKKPPRVTTYMAAASLLTGGACDNKSSAPKNPLPPTAGNIDFGDIEDEAYGHGSYLVPDIALILARIKISVGDVPTDGNGSRGPEQKQRLRERLALIKDSYGSQEPPVRREVSAALKVMRDTLSPKYAWKYTEDERRKLLAEIIAAAAPLESREQRMRETFDLLSQHPDDERRAQRWISDGLDAAAKTLDSGISR